MYSEIDRVREATAVAIRPESAIWKAFQTLVAGDLSGAWRISATQIGAFCKALGIERDKDIHSTSALFICRVTRIVENRRVTIYTVMDAHPDDLAEAVNRAALTPAQAKTEDLRYQVLNSEEMLTGAEAAQAIGSSRQHIHQQHQRGALIGLLHPARERGLRFPKWQFDGSIEAATLKRILETLKNMDHWDKYLFFTSRDESLADLTPLEALRKDEPAEAATAALAFLKLPREDRVQRVVRAAEGFAED